MALAWLDATAGDPEAPNRLRFGVNAQREQGARVGLTFYLALLSDACCHVGRIEDGLEAVAEGLAEVEETGERPWEAELHRIRGKLIGENEAAEAEKSLKRALAIASGQRARSLELRAAIDLAELLDGTDRQPEVLALVANLYLGFIDGHGTPDHQHAKKLISGS
jgi:predicted ATPase